MVKLVSWNIAHRDEPWRTLLESDADIALLQEAAAPPADVAERIEINPGPWNTAGAGVSRPWRTAIVRLSDRVGVHWLETESLPDASHRALAVSRPGTLAAALVAPRDGEPFFVVSIYAVWETPHDLTGSDWIVADGSAHRLISDLSALVGQQKGHRIVVSGDLNILHGYGEGGSQYWADRYATVFDRMKAIGLPFVGPRAPNGRRAEPWPSELPEGSDSVPTYHPTRKSPAAATRQLDFVFASASFADHVRVRALNEVDHWGPSDHCRVEIEVP